MDEGQCNQTQAYEAGLVRSEYWVNDIPVNLGFHVWIKGLVKNI